MSNKVSKVKSISSTGLVVVGPVYLKSLHLTATANATALIQDTAAGGGTDIMKIGCLANSGSSWVAGAEGGVRFADDCGERREQWVTHDPVSLLP